MRIVWENPVLRHAGRLGSRGWFWAALLLLGVTGLLGALAQRYVMELEVYGSPSAHALAGWLGITLVAEMGVVAPWAAARGALLWRRLRRDGQLDEYRRTRMSPLSIAGGLIGAAVYPLVVLVALSLVLSGAGGLVLKALTLREALAAHGVLALQALFYAALGLWLAGKVRYPALAVPLALAALAAAIGGVWAVDPFLRNAADQGRLIYGALLPNPATAVGAALDTDILRFSWLYEHLHTHEYFFVYPPVWQTGLLYAGLVGILVAGISRRIACDTSQA